MEAITTPTQMPKLYAGMNNDDVEFFNFENTVKIIKDGKVSAFSSTPYQSMQLLREAINIDAAAKEILEQWHPDSPVKQVEQFASCRFGGLDFQADIQNNQLQDGEYHPCPQRGLCPAEGILCKLPMYNGKRLTKPMVKMMRLLTTTYTNECIAESLQMPKGSFHLFKKNLYEYLGVQTKQEVTLICRDLNLV